ncbi:hypothetical protein BUALT_Bualt19G0025000 [Buddleja alternifolia]|uniref:Ankyrin repeat-containing protein n=1 Tax=Buddleja alternifolia TaxID=168488 RepID=A0AAV6W4T7_9LAMI|nr:hypothetical protein BUALT_Bualt19G0025000 [Buddleja alternifolia]
MDEISLINAASAGDTAALNQLLQEKPFILPDTAMINSIENVLNTAIKSENFQISTQIARSNRHILTVQDRDGVRPIDVASAYGFVQMVREILILAPNPAEICRLPGKDGKSAIHHASINGRVDVIDELMEKCPDCVRDVTSFGETALHLAVKYYKFEVFKSLLQWLERLGMMEVVNSKDKDGNTVLHYAASKKQLEVVELLLDRNATTRNTVEVNAKNSNGLTAMDLVNIFIESSSDSRLKQVLQDANGSYGAALPVQPSLEVPIAPSVDRQKPKDWAEMMEFFKFNYKRDSASELRNALLVVVALLVTLAFQASINLPSHIFPEDDHPSDNRNSQVVYMAGIAGLLSASVTLMDFLTTDMPFKREMSAAFFSLGLCWGISLASTKLSRTAKDVIYGVNFEHRSSNKCIKMMARSLTPTGITFNVVLVEEMRMEMEKRTEMILESWMHLTRQFLREVLKGRKECRIRLRAEIGFQFRD